MSNGTATKDIEGLIERMMKEFIIVRFKEMMDRLPRDSFYRIAILVKKNYFLGDPAWIRFYTMKEPWKTMEVDISEDMLEALMLMSEGNHEYHDGLYTIFYRKMSYTGYETFSQQWVFVLQ